MEPKYKRILLKLSGEALLGNERNGDPFNPKIIEQYANEIKQLVDLGVEVAIVIGGGNIYRGMNEADSGIERAHGDYMGMLATVINAMAIQAMLENWRVYKITICDQYGASGRTLYQKKSIKTFRKRTCSHFWCRHR
jgi:uridylate kinase